MKSLLTRIQCWMVQFWRTMAVLRQNDRLKSLISPYTLSLLRRLGMKSGIVDASLEDLETLHRIETQCFEKEAFSKHQIKDFLTDYNSISLVARENDEVVGFVICSLSLRRNSFSGHIVTLDVLPDHRREGLAETLLLEVEELLGKKQANEIHLEVRENNLPAIRLYEKLGYRMVGVLKNYYGSTHGLYYVKCLTWP